MAALGTFLYRRGDTYSFRMRVPLRTQDRAGRRDLVRGLRTRDPAVARFLAAAIATRIDGLWAGIAMAEENEIARLIGAWFKREVDRAWRQYASGSQVQAVTAGLEDADERRAFQRYALRTMADDQLDQLSAAFRAGDYSEGREAARAIVAELDAPLDEGDRRFTVIARELMKGQGQIADAQVHWSEGNEDYTPAWEPVLPEALFPRPQAVAMSQAPLVAAPAPPAPAVVPEPILSGVTITGAFDRYMAESPMKPGSKKDFGTAIRRFVELHGDLDLHAIRKAHVVAFKDMLLQLPARVLGADRNMTAPELVRRYQGDAKIARLTALTVNEKGLAALKATLGYAVRNDLMPHNVAEKVAALEARGTGPRRLPYDLDDLRLIFGQETFTKGERPVAGGGEAAVWLPLLALYTGARLEELGTLTVGDVRERDRVRFLFIKEGKTAAARRKVPIHSELIRLGFLDYVKGRGSRPDTRLFPGIGSGDAEATASFSKWWGRYARKVIPDRKKTFHSFRHTVKRALRNAGVDRTLRDAVMGHETSDVAENYGLDEDGAGYALPALAEAIERIGYPNLTTILHGRS